MTLLKRGVIFIFRFALFYLYSHIVATGTPR